MSGIRNLVADGAVLLEPEMYDRALVGVTTDGAAVYSTHGLVEVLMDDGATMEEAMDRIFNDTVPSFRHMREEGGLAPVFVDLVEP